MDTADSAPGTMHLVVIFKLCKSRGVTKSDNDLLLRGLGKGCQDKQNNYSKQVNATHHNKTSL